MSCKAQNPVVGLDAPYNTPDGAYYKDLNVELNKFEGTWVYTNGNTSLTIKLLKKEQMFIEPDYYDVLVGEYKYVNDGEELINTLSNLEQSNVEENIGGGSISKPNQRPRCNSCSVNERRIDLYFNDPEREYLNSNIVLRYIPNSSPPKMAVTIYQRHGGILPYEGAPTVPRVPYGEYLMVKQ